MRSATSRFALAVLAVAVAIALRGLLSPLLGLTNPYLTIWAAIVFVAWYCGLGPAAVATVISALAVWYWFLPPIHSFRMEDSRREITGLVGFVVLAGFIIALGEANRRSKARAQRELAERQRVEHDLRNAQDVLEQKVTEGTRKLEQKTAEAVSQAKLLDLANDAIFVRNADDKISYWNEGAERLYGWAKGETLGRSTHEILCTEFPVPLPQILQSDRWGGELRHTKRDGSQVTVASRWTTLKDNDGKSIGWLELNTDITDRKRAEDVARRLSGRILRLQDEERRRIARALHDSLGQYLTALKLNLHLLSPTEGRQAALASDCSDIVEKCLTETRTISHLLHPPLLDEAGLGSVTQWYVDGFAQRSGIKVNLALACGPARLDSDVETALFRILQEALTNVHRHSGSSEVTIQLDIDTEQARLIVSDNGRGIPADKLSVLESGSGTGIGLAGIRERVRELGGSVELKSDQAGTLLKVGIPIAKNTSLSPGAPAA